MGLLVLKTFDRNRNNVSNLTEYLHMQELYQTLSHEPGLRIKFPLKQAVLSPMFIHVHPKCWLCDYTI